MHNFVNKKDGCQIIRKDAAKGIRKFFRKGKGL